MMEKSPEIPADGFPNLTKFLSTSGIASRRHSAELIKNGLVSVNGSIETNPARRIADSDSVSVNGVVVPRSPGSPEYHYIMLNKPRGYVCTSDDIHAEKKAIDLIQLHDKTRIFSAGRLDKNSEGLLLFSNDGNFIAHLTHPRYEIKKTYEVSVDSPLSQEEISRILHGIRDAFDILKALDVKQLSPTKYRLVLGEGKNREIRRMMQALGHTTKRLKRIAVGHLELHGLDVGKWRELTEEERNLALEDVPIVNITCPQRNNFSLSGEKNVPEGFQGNNNP